MERISVIGTSGSGKTTLARRLAARLDLPHLELDAIYHQPGWTELPEADFRAQVTGFCAGDRWVVCGKYAAVRDLVFARADTIVCLDHHRVRQTLRVARRTVRRVVTHEPLWNGNRETASNLWRLWDPHASLVRWTWDDVPRARRLFDEVAARYEPAGVDVVRLRGWTEVERFATTAGL